MTTNKLPPLSEPSCVNGDKYQCPNMKSDPEDTSMETERYECAVCGDYYKLYYEDMA